MHWNLQMKRRRSASNLCLPSYNACLYLYILSVKKLAVSKLALGLCSLCWLLPYLYYASLCFIISAMLPYFIISGCQFDAAYKIPAPPIINWFSQAFAMLVTVRRHLLQTFHTFRVWLLLRVIRYSHHVHTVVQRG